MGRLTLNVLLSFAQLEREVTSERIRDKIGASKRKGLWVGGVVPLGYLAKDRKITVVADEAKTVRHIFSRYLDLGSLNLLLADLRRTGVKTKLRPLSNGRTIGGIPFTRRSLAALLRNCFYIGEVRYKGEVFQASNPLFSIGPCSMRSSQNLRGSEPITPRPGNSLSHCWWAASSTSVATG